MRSLRHLVMPVRVLPHHSIGGMQTVAWDLATAFARQSISVTVLTAEIPGYPTLFEDAGVRVRTVPGVSWRRYGRPWWRETRNVFESELLESCQLVLSVSAGGFGLLPLRERIPRVPFILQAHGTSMGEVVSKWRTRSFKRIATSMRNLAYIPWECFAYRGFDAIVAVGNRVASDFSAWPIRRVVPGNRVILIRNGIDTVMFRPDVESGRSVRTKLGWGDDLRLVISASRLHRQKGLDLGLQAFALLAKRHGNVRYLIVGDGPELQALKEQAATLGIEEYVHFAGGVTRVLIPAYLNAADVMLFTTTRVEGEPLNVLEALAVGLPVVVSRHLYSGNSPSNEILLTTPNDPVDVAAALERAIEIGPGPLSRLPVGYSMTESVGAYLSLFEELLQHNRP